MKRKLKKISPYFRRGGGGPDYFISSYSGFAYGYSLRQLNPDSQYCVRVRRASDNSELDIGFILNTVANQYLIDVDALEAFCGVGNGFIKTWYDQSGNANHLTQTTSSLQPQIVDSGNVILSNSKPTIYWDGTDDYLTLTSPISDTQPWSSFQVSQRFDSTSMAPLLSSGVGGCPFTVMDYGDNYLYLRDNTRTIISSSTDTTTTQRVLTGIQNGVSGYIWKNETSVEVGAPIGVGGIGDFIDFGRRETVYAKGYCSEFIFFSSDKTDEVVSVYGTIQGNMGSFWGTFIPFAPSSGYLVDVVGQSNGTDRFLQSALPAEYLPSLEDGWVFYKSVDSAADTGIWQRQEAGVNTMIPSGVLGYYAWAYAGSYWSKLTYNKVFYVVPSAVGGTGLDNSFSPGWDPDHANEYYDRSETNSIQARSKMPSVSFTRVLVIDHGQNDAVDATTAANYETNLTAWIEAYRAGFSNASLKVIIILLNDSSIYTYTDDVRTAQINVVSSDANVYSIDGNDYPLQDGEHYTDAAALQLGKDIADLINTF